MKKLFILIIIILISIVLCGCGSTSAKSPNEVDSLIVLDSMFLPQIDTSFLIQDTIKKDSNQLKKETYTRKKMSISKLDTVSVVKEIRKNIETIDIQQKQLDSLIKVKKKK